MAESRPSVIVIGVGGTPEGQAALTFVAREARLRGSGLGVVTTWMWDVDEGDPSLGIPSEMASRVKECRTSRSHMHGR